MRLVNGYMHVSVYERIKCHHPCKCYVYRNPKVSMYRPCNNMRRTDQNLQTFAVWTLNRGHSVGIMLRNVVVAFRNIYLFVRRTRCPDIRIIEVAVRNKTTFQANKTFCSDKSRRDNNHIAMFQANKTFCSDKSREKQPHCNVYAHIYVIYQYVLYNHLILSISVNMWSTCKVSHC